MPGVIPTVNSRTASRGFFCCSHGREDSPWHPLSCARMRQKRPGHFPTSYRVDIPFSYSRPLGRLKFYCQTKFELKVSYGIHLSMKVKATLRFTRWLDKLDDLIGRARILARIRRLSEGNPGQHRRLKFGVSELKVDEGPG